MNNKRYESPLRFFLLIPIGVILIFLIVDFAIQFYNTNKYDNVIKEVYKDTLSQENLDTINDLKEYFYKKLKENEIDENNVQLDFVEQEDCTLLFAKTYYQSFVNQITKKGNKIHYVSLKGYYNEYKEVIIEDYEYDEYIEMDGEENID